jgi:hypothetical protein
LLSQLESSQVLIDLSGDVRYKVGHLSNPERVYIDLPQTEIDPHLTTRRFALDDGFIHGIRMGTSQGPVTRVVLDLAMPVRYRVSKLDKPVQMLIELSRPPEQAAVP